MRIASCGSAGQDQSRWLRLVSFACTGGVAMLCQMGTLLWLIERGWPPLAGSAVAFFAGAQVNFLLSSTLTWRGVGRGSWWRRWILYHGSIVITAPLNVLSFDAARHILPVEVAGAVGVAIAGLANYALADRLVFARGDPCPAQAG